MFEFATNLNILGSFSLCKLVSIYVYNFIIICNINFVGLNIDRQHYFKSGNISNTEDGCILPNLCSSHMISINVD